jgi:photosynthetic reaction center cytochrome c subunit
MKGYGRNFTLVFAGAIAGLLFLALVLTTFERPPVESIQHGFRGTGMDLVYNPRLVEAQLPLNALPEVLDPADDDGPRASEIYENVKVLGNLSAGQFGRVMQAMTNWVAPEDKVQGGGCGYCHNIENMAEDSVYTKVVARRMLQMVKRINAEWQPHVGQTGVTCYTCHRGQPVPAANWSVAAPQGRPQGMLASETGQNRPAPAAGLASLPYDPFTPFLLQDNEIRVNSPTDLPSGNRTSIKQAEWTYGLMVHMAEGLGVNCTYCHNSRAFWDWSQSSPQRVNVWHGIRMVRDVNLNYIQPLQPVFPAHRLGQMGDPLKVNCTTCHQGAYKPLYGAPMLQDYPELNRIQDGPAQSAAASRP